MTRHGPDNDAKSRCSAAPNQQRRAVPDHIGIVACSAEGPNVGEREDMNRIIMEELVNGVFTPAAITYFQRVIARMKDVGCDAVVLGCTEIPLLMNDFNSPLPTLDSTRLLAQAALRRAIGS